MSCSLRWRLKQLENEFPSSHPGPVNLRVGGLFIDRYKPIYTGSIRLTEPLLQDVDKIYSVELIPQPFRVLPEAYEMAFNWLLPTGYKYPCVEFVFSVSICHPSNKQQNIFVPKKDCVII